MAFNYHRELHVWVIPLLLVAFFAYLVAHSFLCLFETVVHSLLMCYAIDMETNDGSSEKPYFMDQDLLVSGAGSRSTGCNTSCNGLGHQKLVWIRITIRINVHT